LLLSQITFGQEQNPLFEESKPKNQFLELNYFYGTIYKHAPDIGHLISGQPTGFQLNYNIATDGSQEWHQVFGFPDYGFSATYQDMKSPILGDVYSIGAYYSFYFLNRHLMFRYAQGLAMNTHPYDRETNFKNNAFGSQFMSSNTLLLQFQKDFKKIPLGFQLGLMLNHYSNARFKFPNRGINTTSLQFGIRYHLTEKKERVISDFEPFEKENIKFNIRFQSGISESPLVGIGQKPFYHLGFYGDKRIGRKSALQLGTEVFWTESLKDYIRFSATAYPETATVIDPNTDHRRVGVFVGHELFINKLSFETQLGYYVYKPFKEEIDIYQRIGLKYYVTPKVFGMVSLKAHAARAEAFEMGIGVRL
jgi:hypothetical protein